MGSVSIIRTMQIDDSMRQALVSSVALAGRLRPTSDYHAAWKCCLGRFLKFCLDAWREYDLNTSRSQPRMGVFAD